MPNKTECCVEGCTDIVYALGYCNKHYQRIRKYNRVEKLKYEVCRVCGDTNYAKGLCSKHYYAFRRYGKFELQNYKNTDKICSVKECTEESVIKGMCRSHYMKFRYKKKKIEKRASQNLSNVL